MSGDFIRQKAETFALKMNIQEFADRRLRGFRKRHGILFKKVCSESGVVDKDMCPNTV